MVRAIIEGLLIITLDGISLHPLITRDPVFSLRVQFLRYFLSSELFPAIVMLANNDFVHGDSLAALEPTLAHQGPFGPRAKPACRPFGYRDARSAPKRLLHVHNEAFVRGQLLVCLYQSLVIRHLILLLAPFRCT